MFCPELPSGTLIPTIVLQQTLRSTGDLILPQGVRVCKCPLMGCRPVQSVFIVCALEILLGIK